MDRILSHSCRTMTEIDQLRNASQGLVWVSESEYPFEVFHWDNADTLVPALVLEHAGYLPDTLIEVQQLDEFFLEATTQQDWHNEEEKAIVKNYQKLVTTLKQNLNSIEVYRIGTTEIDIYIVGTIASGNLAGLKTRVVAT